MCNDVDRSPTNKMTIDYVRYLEAKKSVDDRALNKECMMKFRKSLQCASVQNSPIRIVELGAGTGTMLRRFVHDFENFFGTNPIEYTLVDIKADALSVARKLLLLNRDDDDDDDDDDDQDNISSSDMIDNLISVHHSGIDGVISDAKLPGLIARFKSADVFNFLRSHVGKFDVVVAVSFLDLVSLDEIMPLIRNSMDPTSSLRLFYFPLTFKGVTIFSSLCDDSPILHAFHSSMGRGVAGGVDICRAFTGDYISHAVELLNGKLIACGESNWNVKPQKNETYEKDELYFLQCILQFVFGTTKSELSRHDVTSQDMEKFMKASMTSLGNRMLTYKAHNVDVVGSFHC